MSFGLGVGSGGELDQKSNDDQPIAIDPELRRFEIGRRCGTDDVDWPALPGIRANSREIEVVRRHLLQRCGDRLVVDTRDEGKKWIPRSKRTRGFFGADDIE